MKKLLYLILVAALALIIVLPTAVLACDMTIQVTAAGHLTTTYGWTITKTVNPTSFTFQSGDSGTATYTVALEKDNGTQTANVDGFVQISNVEGFDTSGSTKGTGSITIQVRLKMNGIYIGSNWTSVDVSAKPSLLNGDSHNYGYNIPIDSGDISTTASYQVFAIVTTTYHNKPWNLSSSSIKLPTATLVNNSINVSDTNGQSWNNISASISETYTKVFHCSDAPSFSNTATIIGTTKSSTAIVTVTCEENPGTPPTTSVEVGGNIYPVNKVMMIIPIIILAVAALSVTGIIIWRRQTQK